MSNFAVTNKRVGFGTSQGASPEERMEALRDHIGNRSVGGRFVAWVKNKDGITPKEQGYMQRFQQALADKLGSPEAVNVLFKELGLSPDKPLSARKIQMAMDKADEMATDRDQYKQTRDKQVAKKAAADQSQADAIARAKAKAAQNGTVYQPIKGSGVIIDVDKELSPSAAALRSAITAKFNGSPDENRSAARAVIRCLGLAPNEEVTDAHIDLANKLVSKYEECRGSELHTKMGPIQFPSTYFRSTFENIVKNGWDPRVDLLSSEELIALNAYTQIDYRSINAGLRDNTITPLGQVITDLSVQALSKLPPYDGPVVRGTDLPLGKDKACVRGATISDEAFTSTSASTSFGGSHQFSIHSPGGHDISFLSDKPEEMEVLYPPNHKFTVVSRVGSTDYGTRTDPDSTTIDPGVSQTSIILR